MAQQLDSMNPVIILPAEGVAGTAQRWAICRNLIDVPIPPQVDSELGSKIEPIFSSS